MTTQTSSKPKIIKGIRLEKYLAQGKTLARSNDKTILVNGGAVGDIVDIKLANDNPANLSANIVNITTPAQTRIAEPCRYAPKCGGCQLQHLDYDSQVEAKTGVLNDTLTRLGGSHLPHVSAIHKADKPFYYRNKLSYSFSNKCVTIEPGSAPQNGIGFHVKNAPNTVLNVTECLLQSAISNQIINAARQYAIEHGLTFYRHDKGAGLLRDIVLRQNYRDEIMLILQVGYASDAAKELVLYLADCFPQIIAAHSVVNTGKQTSFVDLPIEHIAGQKVLTDKLGDLNFQISPKAFYQINNEQTVALYNVVRKFAAPSGNETVFDIYCGTGTIGLWLAKDVSKVLGIEKITEAIEDAKNNAAINDISNIDFLARAAEDALASRALKSGSKPDIVIVDPPRAGLSNQLKQALAQLKPKKLIYVSCDPATFARDLKDLSTTFNTERIEAVDMFPQTYHIESVALLTPLKKPSKITPKKRRLKF